MALKVASMIGDEFSLNLILQAYPDEDRIVSGFRTFDIIVLSDSMVLGRHRYANPRGRGGLAGNASSSIG